MEKQNNPKIFYYSLALKREITPEEPEFQEFESYHIVQCYKMVVYGTLRQHDVGYVRFIDNFVCRNSQYYLLEGYKKIHYANMQYFAVVEDPDSVVDCEVFFIYPDTLEQFDQYESIDSGLYRRTNLPDGCFIYTKGIFE